MSASNYGNTKIMCPFFRKQDNASIGCESPIEGTTITIRFRNEREKLRQREIWCEGCYKRCEIYRCVMANRYPNEE